jgi:DNA ligase 1
MKTLYKMTSTGAIQQWDITVWTGNGNPYYEVTYGQVDGQKVVKRTYITEGKNIGRANETTPEEQATLEAESKWTKQRDRKGYTEEIPSDKPLRPMLAKSYPKDGKHIKFPCYVQPKFDGVRCLYKNGKLYSRQNKEFTSLGHIVDTLKGCDHILDGELYSDTLTFQEIVSIVKKGTAKDNADEIMYCVYDVVDENMDFHDRMKLIEGLDLGQHCRKVKSMLCNHPDDIDLHHEDAVEVGYEGIMLRNKLGKYKINGRSSDLQKCKKFLDQEFKILDIVEMDKEPGCGTYVCSHNDVTFKATPKMTREDKKNLLVNKDDYIGKMLTVQFFEWTTSDVPLPRFPIGKIVRDYD